MIFPGDFDEDKTNQFRHSKVAYRPFFGALFATQQQLSHPRSTE